MKFAPVIVTAAIAWNCSGPSEAARAVDRHEAVVEVRPDGSVLITEQLAGRLFDGTAPFERVVPGDRADRIEYIGTSLDGVAWSDGSTQQLEVRVEEGPPLRVRWLWAGGASAPGSMHWRYQLTGATGLREQRGVLHWPVLATPRALSVGESRIELRLPAGIEILRGTGMAEVGWAIDPRPQGMVATRSGLGLEPATLLAEYPVNTAIVPVPDWQLNRDLQGEFAPAFVSAALFMIVIGVGVVWIVRFQHPTIRSRETETADTRPSLSDEAVRALRRGTLPLTPRALGELVDARLIDPDRLAVSRGLQTTVWVGTVVAFFCAVVGHFVLWRFGWWPHVIPISMVGVALLFFAFSRLFRVLTVEGERLRAVLRRG